LPDTTLSVPGTAKLTDDGVVVWSSPPVFPVAVV
jgi:hypothetical protein